MTRPETPPEARSETSSDGRPDEAATGLAGGPPPGLQLVGDLSAQACEGDACLVSPDVDQSVRSANS